MYKRDKMLKEVAEKRLAAIKEFTELGSGFKISMRDLEIRGAGNLLGADQHGHMEAVGYDLYCKMLSEAVRRLKGETVASQDYETGIEIKVDAFIPVGYIKNELQKLDIYKRIAEIETEEEMSDMTDELVDRFGEPPKSGMNLLAIALLKAEAHRAYITEVASRADTLRFAMYPGAKIHAAGIPDLIQEMGKRLRFVPGAEPCFVYTLNEEDKRDLLTRAQAVVCRIAELCRSEGDQ
jgi:Transcription-repair coupling factor (superfamily II helicase)